MTKEYSIGKKKVKKQAKIKDRKGIKLKGWGQKRTNKIDTYEMTKVT